MAKSRVEKESEMQEAVALKDAVEKFDFDSFEFKTLADFDTYNAQARKHNRLCIHERNKIKIKVPGEQFHKKVKIKFNRFDQPTNMLKCCIRNKDIDWKGQLKPGGTYELPLPVVRYLNKLAVPIFAEVKVEHGDAVHTETKQVGETPRFSCSVIDFE